MGLRFVAVVMACLACSGSNRLDQCILIHPESRCVNRRCTSLFWLDRPAGIYTVDASSHIASFFMQVSCNDASIMRVSPSVFRVRSFNSDLSQSHFDALMSALRSIYYSLTLFPRLDIESTNLDENMEALRRRFADINRFEVMYALFKMAQSSLLFAFQGAVQGISDSLVFEGVPADKPMVHRFRQFAMLATQVGALLDMWGDLLVDVHPFTDNCLSCLADNEDSILDLTKRIDDIVDTSVSVCQARREGLLLELVSDVGIGEFLDISKRIQSESLLPLSGYWQDRVCPNMIRIAEYISLVSRRTNWSSELNVGIGSLVKLCLTSTSPEDRIWVSSVLRAPRSLYKALGTETVGFRRAYLEDDSDAFLRHPVRYFGIETVFVIEGSEHVGYVGQRKQWISQMIDRYFRPSGKYFSNIWTFTDDSNRFITLRSGSDTSHVRAAGRVMGFALRHGIPTGIAVGQSFIKLLRVLVNNDIDIDKLLRDEDPAFVGGLETMEMTDWSDPSCCVSWLDFGGLLPNGDAMQVTEVNWRQFVRLRKEQRLWRSMQAELAVFRQGVQDVVGSGIFSMLSELELETRVKERPDILTPEVVFSGIVFRNVDSSEHLHLQIQSWLREVLFDMSHDDLQLFNVFVTGVREPPLTALTTPWIKLFFERSLSTDSLPRTHTCHNELQLPLYESKEQLATKLLTAIRESNSIEGYAGYPNGLDEHTLI